MRITNIARNYLCEAFSLEIRLFLITGNDKFRNAW